MQYAFVRPLLAVDPDNVRLYKLQVERFFSVCVASSRLVSLAFTFRSIGNRGKVRHASRQGERRRPPSVRRGELHEPGLRSHTDESPRCVAGSMFEWLLKNLFHSSRTSSVSTFSVVPE